MPLEGTYSPSPTPFVSDQVRRYEATEGREGGEAQGRPCVILWTRGRKSGAIRKTPLVRVRDGDRYAVVASLGGGPRHPLWFLNILADPRVTLRDGAELRDYAARVAEGAERAEWWSKATAVGPAYEEYQAKTSREIPVVILEPVD